MLRALDRGSELSLYAQAKHLLRELIENEEWLPGQMIPTEKELEQVLGVSRSTVRQALQELVNEGYIRRHVGKGTFVSPAKIQDRTQRVGTMVQQRYGIRSQSQILEYSELDSPTPQVLKYLDVRPGTSVIYFRRLLLEDGIPFGLSTVHAVVGRGLLISRATLETHSISHIIRVHGNGKVVRSERSLEAVVPSETEQKILQVSPTSPMLLSRSITYNDADDRVGITKAIYRGDRFKYTLTVTY